MLTLTPAAAREIQSAALRSGLPDDDWALRIAADVDAEGAIRFGLGFDEEREADLRSRERTTERQARRRQDVAFARWAVRRGRRWAARAGRVGARGSQGWRAAQVLLGGQIRP
jgi:hypothetical protein